jgi:hypothetical protein
MAILARGMITIAAVNDAYSALLTPNSCVIKANFDGSDPQLGNAYTNITLTSGTSLVPFTLAQTKISNPNIKYSITNVDGNTKKVQLTNIPTTISDGSVEFKLTYGDYSVKATFQFTVVRESTMLDWVQEWEGSKTKIGSNFVISPKIFVGKKNESNGHLTGVYIGSSLGGAPSPGIYGFKDGTDIFHLNESEGRIGGWIMRNDGIQTEDGKIQILSEGVIRSHSWELHKSGAAYFAKKNVKFDSDGSAYFKGEVSAGSGKIGGWTISENAMNSANISIDSDRQHILIFASNIQNVKTDSVKVKGGIAMGHTSANDYGIAAYLPKQGDKERVTFKLGSINRIAGWNFDEDALWIGTKANTLRYYTPNNSSLTIGSKGLRGHGWCIDTDGKANFANGHVTFDRNGGKVGGWTLAADAIYTGTLVSSGFAAEGHITIGTNGIRSNKWRLEKDGSGALAGGRITWDKDGNANIVGWNTTTTAIYTGTVTGEGFTPGEGHITIGHNGIRGYKWRLEKDGSGALAGGKISWDKEGKINIGDTIGNKTGITNGMVLTKSIYVCDTEGVIKAGVSAEGTGATGYRFFAGSSDPSKASFRVNENGRLFANNVEIEGSVKATSGSIGGFEISNARIGVKNENRGLMLKTDVMRFWGDKAWAGFGTGATQLWLDSFGYRQSLCRLEYAGNEVGVQSLHVKCRPTTQFNPNNHPCPSAAIRYDGDIYGLGGRAIFEDSYIGPYLGNDMIYNRFFYTHTFIITDYASSNYVNVNLPGEDLVELHTGTKRVTFEIFILHNASGYKLRISGVPQGRLMNISGAPINGGSGWVDLIHGTSIRLRYSWSKWFIVSYRTRDN